MFYTESLLASLDYIEGFWYPDNDGAYIYIYVVQIQDPDPLRIYQTCRSIGHHWTLSYSQDAKSYQKTTTHVPPIRINIFSSCTQFQSPRGGNLIPGLSERTKPGGILKKVSCTFQPQNYKYRNFWEILI